MPEILPRKPSSWMQIATYSELAVIFPAATVVGWLVGAGAGPLAAHALAVSGGADTGDLAGFIELIRMVSSSEADQ